MSRVRHKSASANSRASSRASRIGRGGPKEDTSVPFAWLLATTAYDKPVQDYMSAMGGIKITRRNLESVMANPKMNLHKVKEPLPSSPLGASTSSSFSVSTTAMSNFTTRSQPLAVFGVEPIYSKSKGETQQCPPPTPAQTPLPQQRLWLDSPRRAVRAIYRDHHSEVVRLKREALESYRQTLSSQDRRPVAVPHYDLATIGASRHRVSRLPVQPSRSEQHEALSAARPRPAQAALPASNFFDGEPASPSGTGDGGAASASLVSFGSLPRLAASSTDDAHSSSSRVLQPTSSPPVSSLRASTSTDGDPQATQVVTAPMAGFEAIPAMPSHDNNPPSVSSSSPSKSGVPPPASSSLASSAPLLTACATATSSVDNPIDDPRRSDHHSSAQDARAENHLVERGGTPTPHSFRVHSIGEEDEDITSQLVSGRDSMTSTGARLGRVHGVAPLDPWGAELLHGQGFRGAGKRNPPLLRNPRFAYPTRKQLAQQRESLLAANPKPSSGGGEEDLHSYERAASTSQLSPLMRHHASHHQGGDGSLSISSEAKPAASARQLSPERRTRTKSPPPNISSFDHADSPTRLAAAAAAAAVPRPDPKTRAPPGEKLPTRDTTPEWSGVHVYDRVELANKQEVNVAPPRSERTPASSPPPSMIAPLESCVPARKSRLIPMRKGSGSGR